MNQAGEIIGTVVNDVEKNPTAAATELHKVEVYASSGQAGSWLKNNTRTIEKWLAYGAGLVGATDGFAQLGMPAGLRTALIAVAGLVIAADKING